MKRLNLRLSRLGGLEYAFFDFSLVRGYGVGRKENLIMETTGASLDLWLFAILAVFVIAAIFTGLIALFFFKRSRQRARGAFFPGDLISPLSAISAIQQEVLDAVYPELATHLSLEVIACKFEYGEFWVRIRDTKTLQILSFKGSRGERERWYRAKLFYLCG